MRVQIKRRDEESLSTEGLLGKDYCFIIDDIDFSDHLIEFGLIMGVKDLNQCVIKFMPNDVEIDADALAHLRARFEVDDVDDAEARS